MAKVKPRFRRTYRKTFIRQWRKHRGLTLERLSDRLIELSPELKGTTHASLGRIERGIQPYNQALLEALAIALDTDPASLLMRDPTDPEGIWSVWDQAKPGHRRQIVEIAKTITKAA